MNPWGFVVIGLGVLLVIMGVKGTYENVANALKSTGPATGRITTVPKLSHVPGRPPVGTA